MNLSKTKAIKMLEEIFKLSLNASMAGQLCDGAELLMINYNKIRDIAIKNGWVDEEWVPELKQGELLKENTEWSDVIGTATKLFLAQFDDDDDDDDKEESHNKEKKHEPKFHVRIEQKEDNEE